MANDTLSQNDIDALLNGGGRAQPVIPQSDARNLQVYDFRRPHRVSKDRLRTLEAMYERLVKSLEGWLIGRVRGQVELRLQSVEQYSFGEFTLSLPTPCASFLIDIKNSGGRQAVIDFGHEFAYFLVDRLFGGGAAPTIMPRGLSPIERMAVRIVAERVSGLVGEIWQDHVDLDLNLTGFESFPEIMQAVDKDEPVLVANLEVSAAGMSSLVLICLPFSVLDKFFATSEQKRVNSAPTSDADKVRNREVTELSLRATSVQVSARLPEFQMSMRDLSQLAVGSVLSTGVARDATLQVMVGGQQRFKAAAGKVGRKLAVRVLDAVSQNAAPAPSPSAPNDA